MAWLHPGPQGYASRPSGVCIQALRLLLISTATRGEVNHGPLCPGQRTLDVCILMASPHHPAAVHEHAEYHTKLSTHLPQPLVVSVFIQFFTFHSLPDIWPQQCVCVEYGLSTMCPCPEYSICALNTGYQQCICALNAGYQQYPCVQASYQQCIRV
jgi:hypothetical protein